MIPQITNSANPAPGHRQSNGLCSGSQVPISPNTRFCRGCSAVPRSQQVLNASAQALHGRRISLVPVSLARSRQRNHRSWYFLSLPEGRLPIIYSSRDIFPHHFWKCKWSHMVAFSIRYWLENKLQFETPDVLDLIFWPYVCIFNDDSFLNLSGNSESIYHAGREINWVSEQSHSSFRRVVFQLIVTLSSAWSVQKAPGICYFLYMAFQLSIGNQFSSLKNRCLIYFFHWIKPKAFLGALNWEFHFWSKFLEDSITRDSNLLGINATGLTFSEDPMTIRRSTSFLSYFMARWNCSGKFSPKNTISGFMIARGSSGGHLGHLGTTCSTTAAATTIQGCTLENLRF